MLRGCGVGWSKVTSTANAVPMDASPFLIQEIWLWCETFGVLGIPPDWWVRFLIYWATESAHPR